MDRDLHDDTLKLVRYKVLFVKREYEHAFPEQEDLVSANMDGTAFTAWKVAEFIQQLGRGETAVPHKWSEKNYPGGEYASSGLLLGLRDEDKKYLRVYYEVLERYPRGKFKYEQRQVKALSQIRDALAQGGSSRRASSVAAASSRPQPAHAQGDPYEELLGRLDASGNAFGRWRLSLSHCARRLGKELAGLFNSYREVGMFTAPALTPEEFRAALRQAAQPFDRASFDRFTGAARGDLRLYATQAQASPPAEIPTPPAYSVWGGTEERGGRFVQRITASGRGFVPPDDRTKLKRSLSEGSVDLTVNVYDADLGVVSWVAFHRNRADNHLRSIGYEMNGRVLWFNQLLDREASPLLGPLPSPPGVAPLVVEQNQFLVSVEWAEDVGGKRCFLVYGLYLNFDFERCAVAFAGRVLKMRNEVTAS
jgi:hypothetical protein